MGSVIVGECFKKEAEESATNSWYAIISDLINNESRHKYYFSLIVIGKKKLRGRR